MRPVVTPAQMGEADRAAIAAGTPAGVLMERAGTAVARAALREAGGRYGRRAVVVCGTGNNGGDGFVAARRLAREGLGVRCFIVGDAGRISGDARVHLDLATAQGVPIDSFGGALPPCDVVVDALFGTGFHGALSGDARAAVDAINDAGARVVAVDIPSGVDGRDGGVRDVAVRADATVVFAADKVGTSVSSGAEHSGRVEVVDIGIPVDSVAARLVEWEDVRRALPVRPATAHKRTSGSVALLGGSAGMSGAALLMARGALRGGAGYATLGAVADVARAAASLPEMLTRSLGDGKVLDRSSLEGFADVIERADCVACGPGLGRGTPQTEMVEHLLRAVDVPLVLDADALNALEGGASMIADRTGATVITPHPAELARLLGRGVPEIQNDRLAAAAEAASRWACTVLLKGFRTIAATPEGDVFINPTGGPELATAGTGDVLTGVIAALVARGLGPDAAAWAGAFVHGVAGAVAAERTAPAVTAGDVADALAEAQRRLLSPPDRPRTARLP